MSFATSNSRVKRLTQKKSSTAKKNNPEISDASSVGSLNVREDFVAVTEERDIDSLGLQTMQNLRRMMDQHNVKTTRQRSLSKSKSISPVKKMSTKNVMNKTQTTAALRNLDTYRQIPGLPGLYRIDQEWHWLVCRSRQDCHSLRKTSEYICQWW